MQENDWSSSAIKNTVGLRPKFGPRPTDRNSKLRPSVALSSPLLSSQLSISVLFKRKMTAYN